jgi:predicted DCC family thiol-disulfide oxidoreductase YuxK
LFERESRRAGIDFAGGGIERTLYLVPLRGQAHVKIVVSRYFSVIRPLLAARTDDGYDEHMSDAPEPTLSPNESASAPAKGVGTSPTVDRAEAAGWQKPLLIFDGDCGFCRRWITRWQSMTGDRIIYAPYQEIGEQFPQISHQEFVTAVQLVDTDGQIFSGAEAVFRALAQVPGKGWGLWFYRHVPGFAPVSRAVYRFVAGHRYGLSTVTRWFWGRGNAR